MNKDRVFFENGSSRSERRPPYHLVPVEAVQAIAERMGIGLAVHGEENWKKGGPEFFAETRNHLEHHWLMLKSGDESDDNLSAVLTNAAMLAWWARTGKAKWEAREAAKCDAEMQRCQRSAADQGLALAERMGATIGQLDWVAEKRAIGQKR